MREILVAVTFREFNGDINSVIQEMFLDSIKKQTYKNFRIVVTNYREKTVKQKLIDIKIPFVFFQSERKCKWSWGEVVYNAISIAEEGKHIILWTNADVIYDQNFFEEIIKNFKPGAGGTSHPVFHYYTPEDLLNKKSVDTYFNKSAKSFWDYDPNIFIPELMYIDGDLMLQANNRQMFYDYIMEGHAPGFSISLMFGFYAKPIYNLVLRTKAHSVRSSKAIGHCPDEEFNANDTLLIEFCRKRNISRIYYKPNIFIGRKILIHMTYKPIGTFLGKYFYKMYYIYYLFFPRGSFFLVHKLKAIMKRLKKIKQYS